MMPLQTHNGTILMQRHLLSMLGADPPIEALQAEEAVVQAPPRLAMRLAE